MLIGISGLISSELLAILDRMGHDNEAILVDKNVPSVFAKLLRHETA